MTDEPLFDPLPLAELRRHHGPDLVREVLALFRETCRTSLADLHVSSEPTVIHRHAHRLKGAAALIGLRQLACACTTLETSPDLPAAIAHLVDTAQRSLSAVADAPI